MAAAYGDQLQAGRELAAARGEQYAQVIDIGPRWDTDAPLPHLISNGSRAFVVCLADQPDQDWDGTYVTVVSPGGTRPSLSVVIEMWGCAEIRFGGPNDEATAGHPLHGREASRSLNTRVIRTVSALVRGGLGRC